MVDVLTFGETMLVFSPESTGPLRHVDSFRKSIGGAESNVAIGLSRLGRTAAWVSKVSADPMGDYVRSVIRGEGVDVSHVLQDPAGFTGLIVKERPGYGDPNVFFYRKGAAASTFRPEEFPLRALDGVRILHATGIFPALSPECRETARLVFRAARQRSIPISFDPNMRRKLWTADEARPVLLELAAQAEYLLPGLDEAELLVGPGEPE
ncbi:MAG TPA: sugar kinase, partial [Symbiobacteriaceae bacterium]|nr:sugar kinase [Symbiobacteriaceae bacterium]